MALLYDRSFFDWVRLTAVRSAERLLPIVLGMVRPTSVVDVGCGEGAWLSVWVKLGVADVLGFDGVYIDAEALMFPAEQFMAADLAQPIAILRRFDLVQSLEVAEHLPAAASETFVASLCALGDIVLFSAARPGQGGENHVNERLPSAWAALFDANGYAAFDCIRPHMLRMPEIAPWYRHNTVLYANAVGRQRLDKEAVATLCTDYEGLDAGGDWRWRMRMRLLKPLPVAAVSALSRLRYRLACARHALRPARV